MLGHSNTNMTRHYARILDSSIMRDMQTVAKAMNDGIILRTSPEFTALRKNLLQAIERLDGLLAELRPSIRSETYLTSEEVRMIFDLCPRSLQNYRDNRLIPYTTIGGKILYPQSAILELLEANFVDVRR